MSQSLKWDIFHLYGEINLYTDFFIHRDWIYLRTQRLFMNINNILCWSTVVSWPTEGSCDKIKVKF